MSTPIKRESDVTANGQQEPMATADADRFVEGPTSHVQITKNEEAQEDKGAQDSAYPEALREPKALDESTSLSENLKKSSSENAAADISSTVEKSSPHSTSSAAAVSLHDDSRRDSAVDEKMTGVEPELAMKPSPKLAGSTDFDQAQSDGSLLEDAVTGKVKDDHGHNNDDELATGLDNNKTLKDAAKSDGENETKMDSAAVEPQSTSGANNFNHRGNSIEGQPYLLSTDTTREELGDYYYEGVENLWLCDLDDRPGKCIVCRHCLWSAKHASHELLAKGFCHAVLHILNSCPDVPAAIKDRLTEYRNRPVKMNGPQGSLALFCAASWDKPTAVIHRASRKRARPRPRTSKPKTILAGKRSRDQTGPNDEENGSKRPRRKSASSLPSRYVPMEDEEDDSPKRTARKSKSEIRVAEALAKAPTISMSSLEIDESGTWSFIEDGKYPIRKLYETVTEFGKEYVKRIFHEKEKKHRLHRIMKIMKEIQRLVDLGLEVDEVLDALHVFQAGRSLYSFSDDLKDLKLEDMKKLSAAGESTGQISERPAEKVSHKPVKPRVFVEPDPCQDFFREETAFLFHDNKSTEDCKRLRLPEEPLDELQPLPPAMESPKLTGSEHIRYSYEDDERKRILHVHFSGVSRGELSNDELRMYGSALERDDIAVITHGLIDLNGMKSNLWDLTAIQRASGGRAHHKFKRYTKTGPAVYSETNDLLEGTMETFVDYLGSHVNYLKSEIKEPDRIFEFRTERGEPVAVTSNDVVYMLDLDLPRILPRHCDDFVRNFKLPEIMPGGDWCMMNAISPSARPFMGPNCYVTPGGAYTQLHQDGHGTVDSGHCCLEGYNEVVMLRRMPERHKEHATTLMPNSGGYDALYMFPHGVGNKPDWPTTDTIKDWERMGYAPSVFILEPGQHVHINKGRLHAFRKMTSEELPLTDCHYELRRALLSRLNTKTVPLCVSVAWDWQFIGMQPEAINREVTSTLECQILLYGKKWTKCLAVPRASLLSLAFYCRSASEKGQMTMLHGSQSIFPEDQVVSSDSLLKGIAPSLQFILDQNIEFIEHAKSLPATPGAGRLRLEHEKDTAVNPLHTTVDPDGNDYFCGICSRELENVYLHCDGCEDLLGKDFNICTNCYATNQWKQTIDVTGRGLGEHRANSAFCHTGGYASQHGTCGRCSKTPRCRDCNQCPGCSCICHSWYTIRRRFYDLEELQSLSDWVKTSIGGDAVENAKFTEPRLLVATDRRGRGNEAKRSILKMYPNNSVQIEKAEAAGEEHETDHEGDPMEPQCIVVEAGWKVEQEDNHSEKNDDLKPPPSAVSSSTMSKEPADGAAEDTIMTASSNGIDAPEVDGDLQQGESVSDEMVNVQSQESVNAKPSQDNSPRGVKIKFPSRPVKVKRNILKVGGGAKGRNGKMGSKSPREADVMDIVQPHPSIEGKKGVLSPVDLKLRSAWWLAFHLNRNQTEIYCNCCGKTIVYDKRNASNDLKQHLKSTHPEVNQRIAKINSNKFDLPSYVEAGLSAAKASGPKSTSKSLNHKRAKRSIGQSRMQTEPADEGSSSERDASNETSKTMGDEGAIWRLDC